MDALHLAQYSAIAIDGHAVLIAGPAGCGKTTLCLSLIDRGAQLVGDDGIALSVEEGKLIASPPPRTRGLLEIRNVGIVTLRCISAPVALILQVDPGAPRFVEEAEREHHLGIAIPAIRFSLHDEANAIRAEYALRIHGLLQGDGPVQTR